MFHFFKFFKQEAGKQVFLGPQRGAKPTQNTQPNRSPVQPTLQPQLPQVQSQPQQQLESPKPKIDKTKFDSKMTNSFNELYSLKKIDVFSFKFPFPNFCHFNHSPFLFFKKKTIGYRRRF